MTSPKTTPSLSLGPTLAAGAALLMIGAMLLCAPASAGERDATAAETRKVAAALRPQGYHSIRDVDVIGATFVVDAISPSGDDVDIVLDRATLKILRVDRS